MQQKTSRRILIMAALSAALLVYYNAGWLHPITDAATGVLLAVAGPVHAASVHVRQAVAQASGAAGPDDGLRKALDDLKIENAKLRTLVAENESLKAALRYQERYKDATVVARVVSESNDDSLRALVIDQGTQDGLAPGQPVIVGDGLLIGKIFEVRRLTATVLLLSDSRSRLAVALQNGDDTIGVLQGERGLSMSIGLIPQSANVAPGDVVVTSGAEAGIRRGLVIGEVAAVAKNTQDPFQSADVQPFFNSTHPIFVQILTPGRL